MNENDNNLSGSQVETAVEILRSRIMDLTIEPGSRIDERLLVDKFGFGRTPAREALNRLASEGFVKILANRGGAIVIPMHLDDLTQLIEAHQFCEAMLGQRLQINDPNLLEDLINIQTLYVAAVRNRNFPLITQINTQFHMRFYATMRNELISAYALKIWRMVSRVLNWTYRHELFDTAHQDAQFALNLAQHEAIIAAVERRDVNKLRELLPDHANYVQRRLVHILNGQMMTSDKFQIAPTEF